MSDLNELLNSVWLDDSAGILYWKDGQRKGKEAGTLDTTGYKRFKFKGKMYYTHRVIYAFYKGKMPDGHIDHKDGNKKNNVFNNLRLCTPSQNQANQKKSIKNTTGHKDVSFVENLGLYRVRVSINKKRYEFGYYKNLDDAALVATTARITLHKEFANHV